MRLYLVLIALCCASPAIAAEWTGTNTALQATYTALHVVDWLQTAEIARHSVRYETVRHDGKTYRTSSSEQWESNPILGRHPRERDVHLYFAGTLLAHTAVSYLLPKGWREAWQAAGIGVEAWCVAGNFKAGINGGF